MVATAEQVKELRDRTGAGMMDCKAALEASKGDVEKAIDALRKKGMAQAAKRAGREAKDGLIVCRVEKKKAALLEVNCETDFVARTDDFKKLSDLALESVFTSGENAIQSEKVQKVVSELSGKIGEKLLVRRARVMESKDGTFYSYTHSTKKLAVVAEIKAQKADGTIAELGKNIAMHIAASAPLCLDREGVAPEVLERERAIFKAEVKNKPENIVEKIVRGKLEKFYKSVCLLEQPYVKDDKLSIKKLLEQTAKQSGTSIEIKGFTRFQLGEKI